MVLYFTPNSLIIVGTEIAAKVGEILSHLHPIASTVTPLDHPMDGEDSTHVVLLDEDTTRDLWKATISISERIMSEVSTQSCALIRCRPTLLSV